MMSVACKNGPNFNDMGGVGRELPKSLESKHPRAAHGENPHIWWYNQFIDYRNTTSGGRKGKYPMPGFFDIEMPNCVQISIFQDYKLQTCINRFFYEAQNDLFNNETVLTDFWAVFYAYLRSVQAAALTYDKLNITWLFGPRHSYDKVLSGQVGLASGEGMPAFIGSRFRLVPGYSRVRKGRKILTGVTEPMMEGDDLAAGYVTSMGNLAGLMDDTLTLDGQSFVPVLISPPNTRHTTLEISPIVASSYVGWSTQSSRKIGRGA